MALFNAFTTKFKNVIFLIYSFLALGCTQLNHSSNDDHLDSVSSKIKVNELLDKVTSHYTQHPGDPLKIEAARFLIRNMKGLYYYDGAALNSYLKYLELINHDRNKGLYIMKFLNDKYANFSTQSLTKHHYTDVIQAKDIIENIDMAFKVWREQPWGKEISFKVFREYILPFQVGDELPENNRKEIYEKFNPLLDSLVKTGASVSQACTFVNEKLKKDGWLFSNKVGFLPHFSASTLLKYKTGSCRDMTSMTIFIMRAVGIPVGTDIAPQWAYRNGDHIWNTLKDNDNHVIAFMGTDDSPGTQHKPGSKKGKVYRNTYAINFQSLAMKKNAEDVIPGFFENPRIKDVTSEYTRTYRIDIQTLHKPKRNHRFAYACLFDDTEWKPVQWTYANSNVLQFQDMEPDVVYLPAFFRQNGTIMPANYPVVLKNDGSTLILKPDSNALHQQMTLQRTYSIIPERFQVRNFKGKFELANQADFSDATVVNTPAQVLPYLNTVLLKSSNLYRFIRFIPARGKHCILGEFEIYGSGKKLKAEFLGSVLQIQGDTSKSVNKAIDGDLSTFFESKFSEGAWLGFDLQKRQLIDSIKFSTAYDEPHDVKIQFEKEYELFYWDGQNQWVSMGTKKASQDWGINFSNVPSNALYRLKNVSTQIFGRIFTYSNHKQVWW